MSSDCINARTVLWYVTFFGFAVNYMIRININIAIVDMVLPRTKPNGPTLGECLGPSESRNYSLEVEEKISNSTIPALFSEVSERFDWDEYQQGLVLGSFYWVHWLTQLPGGILAQRYGAKNVFGISQLATCILCYLIPIASYHSLNSVIFIRLLQGFIAGFVWPAMHHLTGQWIPPNERSKFVTAYMGSSVGAALTYPFCGVLIDAFGWDSVFYVTATLGVLWYVFWAILVYDSPSEHPRISHKERRHIETSLGQSGKKEKLQTPWRHVLLSLPLWMNIIAQWGGIWSLFTMLVQAPTYFKFIHGWDVKATGFFSGLPHMARMLFSIIFSSFADYLLRSNKMSRTNVRKLGTLTCNVGQGAMILILAFVGCNSTAAIVFATTATALHGAVSSGPLAAVVDIAPNFAGISLGLCGMISVMPGFIIPALVGALTFNNQTIGQWQIIYLISAIMTITCGILFVAFSDSEVQPWNSPKRKEKEEVAQPLKPISDFSRES